MQECKKYSLKQLRLVTLQLGHYCLDRVIKGKELGDDFFADFIIKHTGKQEHINEILASKGSHYRIGNIELEVGISPKVVYVIEKQSGD